MSLGTREGGVVKPWHKGLGIATTMAPLDPLQCSQGGGVAGHQAWEVLTGKMAGVFCPALRFDILGIPRTLRKFGFSRFGVPRGG